MAHFRLLLAACAAAALLIPLRAAAGPIEAASTFATSQNMHALGFSARESTTSPFTANSDLAFWGRTAYHGNYDGFRIVDISAPANPKLVTDYRDCAGNQGDVIIWEHILVRSWNSPAPAGATCDGEPVPLGWEGVHVFDVSDPADPDLVGSVQTACGSHTETAVPDAANGRLLVYNNSSSGSAACAGLDIIAVPLDDPAAAAYLRFEPAGRSCHDSGVILGEAMLAACAGSVGGQPGYTVWSLGGPRGGSLEDPAQLYSFNVTGTTTGHSAAFSWDGEILVFGTEPGGGSGLLIWNLSDPAVAGALKLGHLNPQTQEFTID